MIPDINRICENFQTDIGIEYIIFYIVHRIVLFVTLIPLPGAKMR